MFTFRIFCYLAIVFLLINCSTDNNVNLYQKVKGKPGNSYSLTDLAWQRLDLPAPGIDSSNTVPVTIYPDQQILEIAVGPVDIKANTPHYLIPVHVTSMPFDVWLHSVDWAITDANNNPLNSAFLHHFNMIDPNKRELFYPIARRLFAAGRETPATSLPPLMGMPIERDYPILLSTMFQNATNKDYKDIYFRIWFEYRSKDQLIDAIEVLPFTLDAGGPVAPRDFDVPPGESKTTTTASPVVDAKIYGIGGHLHDYGKYVKVYDATDQEEIWFAEPVESENKKGHVLTMPTDMFLPPKKVEKGHLIKTIAQYDNPLDKPSPEKGMGTIGGVFRTSSDSAWYQLDKNNQTYLNDMIMLLGGPGIHHWKELSPTEMRARLGLDQGSSN